MRVLRLRRNALLGVGFVVGGVSCGIDLIGKLDPNAATGTTDLADAQKEDDRLDNSDNRTDGDASSLDAFTPPCTEAGSTVGFCDSCDPALRLCISFDDGKITDESTYAQNISVVGVGFTAPTFVPDGVRGTSALSMDGSATLRVPHGPPWAQYSDLTVEVWMRLGQLPPPGGRAGLIDKNGGFSIFLQPNGDLVCHLGTRANLGAVLGWAHVACVTQNGSTTIYVRGVRMDESDATPPVQSTGEMAIGCNAPSGDPFVGDLDGLRVYTRAKSAAEIAAAADAN